MKKSVFLVFFLLYANITANSQSSCLPEGISFTTQAQINNFQVNYPGCTEIVGNVHIEEGYLQSILNLNGLSSLTSIGGGLWIEENEDLTSLTGLEGLTSIGGTFMIFYNSSLASLTGLEGLNSVGNYFMIIGNDALTSLTGLGGLTSVENLEILDNDALLSLAGLGGLTFIGSHFSIVDNDALTALSGLESLTAIDFNFWIESNDALTSLTGLEGLTSIGAGLSIEENIAMTSLSGLEGLTSLGSFLSIQGNIALTSLAGLENIQLSPLTTLYIYNNSTLEECDVYSICQYLEAPNGIIEIHDNAPGCNSQTEVEEACGAPCLPQGIIFTSQEQIDNFQINYPLCNAIEGNVEIDGSWTGNITNLNGLSILQSIGGDLWVYGLLQLTDFTGLNNINTIGGNVKVEQTYFITNFEGFDVLDTIGGNLEIYGNASLEDLAGLENLKSIGGDLKIGYLSEVPPFGANPILTSLNGLNHLIEIGGDFIVENNNSLSNITSLDSLNFIGEKLKIEFNNNLSSLTGLDNVDSNSIEELVIWGNSSLSDCSVQGICNFLSSPNGTVDIGYNAPGCNSIIEIADSCGLPFLPCLPNGNYYFQFQTDVDSFQVNFPLCTQLHGDVFIYGSDIESLTGLSCVTSIWGRLFIENTMLADLEGLDNLNETAGLYISNNTELTGLWNLDGIITNWGFIYIINNPKLAGLVGIDNLETEMISQVIIYDNDILSKCDVQSICNYISIPNCELEIYNNAPGCNSPVEVEEHCLTQVEPYMALSGVKIIPNPSNDKITLSLSEIRGNTLLEIFNVNGEKVIDQDIKSNETQLDISVLMRGVYFVRVRDEKIIETVKMIKQ